MNNKELTNIRDEKKSSHKRSSKKSRYDLVGIDGNAFSIIGYVSNALKESGHNNLKAEYMTKAMSGSYYNLIAVSQDYIDIANGS